LNTPTDSHQEIGMLLAGKRPPLPTLPTLAEIAETAAFLASDRAGAITGAVINLTCGSLTGS
jgi:enoyl-[acyl-carrier-protein] reductase (NADH)